MAIFGFHAHASHACQRVAWVVHVEMGCITHNYSCKFPKQMSYDTADLQDKKLIALREVEKRP